MLVAVVLLVVAVSIMVALVVVVLVVAVVSCGFNVLNGTFWGHNFCHTVRHTRGDKN